MIFRIVNRTSGDVGVAGVIVPARGSFDWNPNGEPTDRQLADLKACSSAGLVSYTVLDDPSIPADLEATLVTSVTTAERDSLQSSTGMVVWNSTTAQLEVYSGSAWSPAVPAQTGGGSQRAAALLLDNPVSAPYANGAESWIDFTVDGVTVRFTFENVSGNISRTGLNAVSLGTMGGGMDTVEDFINYLAIGFKLLEDAGDLAAGSVSGIFSRGEWTVVPSASYAGNSLPVADIVFGERTVDFESAFEVSILLGADFVGVSVAP